VSSYLFLQIARLYKWSIIVFWSFRPIKYSEIEKIHSLSGKVAEVAVYHSQAQDKTLVFVNEDAHLNGYEPENGPAIF